MAKQHRSLLIKIGDGAGSEAFTAIAGLNSNPSRLTTVQLMSPRLTLPRRRALWASNLNCLKSMSISGDGIFLDESVQEGRLNTIAMQADPVANFELVVPDFELTQANFALLLWSLAAKLKVPQLSLCRLRATELSLTRNGYYC